MAQPIISMGVGDEALVPPPLPAISRALIVDDDPEVCTLLKTRLQARGFDVFSATSGEDGLARLHDARSDVIFLDISMPGLSGLDVLGSIREQQLDCAVIMTTAVESIDVAIEALLTVVVLRRQVSEEMKSIEPETAEPAA